jgi:hypothetical protein
MPQLRSLDEDGGSLMKTTLLSTSAAVVALAVAASYVLPSKQTPPQSEPSSLALVR